MVTIRASLALAVLAACGGGKADTRALGPTPRGMGAARDRDGEVCSDVASRGCRAD